MEKRMHDMASLFVANGFGFGEYWTGYIFARNAKDNYSLYLTDTRMAVLSAGIDEDGEKGIVVATDHFTGEELNSWFSLDHSKKSLIDWFKPVNFVLLCKDKATMRNNISYYFWPAVKTSFSTVPSANSIVVYDRFVFQEVLDDIKEIAKNNGITGQIEYWSVIKLLTYGDKFGSLAPKVCMESIPLSDS